MRAEGSSVREFFISLQKDMVKSLNIATLFVLCALVAGCVSRSTNYRTVDGVMLGTTFHVVAECALEEQDIYRALGQIDSQMRSSMSIFDEGSLLSRVNANKTDELDDHIVRNIEVAANMYSISDGLYDITVKPLTDAYGFAAKGRIDRPNIDSLLETVGFSKFRVEGRRIVKSDPRVQLDLNSIAKGYAVDCVAAWLDSVGSLNYIVEIGGEIRSRGVNARGVAWRVAVDAPHEGNNTPGLYRQTVVNVGDAALASSGNYRRYYTTAEGEKVAHTINPKTGVSAYSRLLSATVITRRCVVADALATMFMVVGEQRAVALAEQMRDSVQVYFVLAPRRGEEFEVFSTLAPDVEQ